MAIAKRFPLHCRYNAFGSVTLLFVYDSEDSSVSDFSTNESCHTYRSGNTKMKYCHATTGEW